MYIKFKAFYTETSAVSGDNRNTYLKHTASGTIAATGYVDCLRAYTVVTGTGYSYASGIHATMSVGVGGTVTGSGSARSRTYHCPRTLWYTAAAPLIIPVMRWMGET